jgi:DNA processing protein
VGFAALLAEYGSGSAILAEVASPGGVDRVAAIRYLTHGAPGDRIPIAVAKRLADAAHDADATLARIAAVGLTVVTTFDQAYPARLAAIDMPPPVLFVLGDPAAMDRGSAVAIVGTRRPTESGRAIAARIASALAAVGATVVSGLATGIDGAAHAATLHAQGTTVAVIGSGHARLFPRLHARLAESIAGRGGAVVSELAPDIDATRGTFPRRNRVISGLADATVVVEAPARSGALITASWALEQGRGCFLVPGSIDAHASAGCLAFLREYPGEARVVAGIPQLIADLGLSARVNAPELSRDAASSLVEVGATAARIGQELVHGRTTVDELVAATGWPVATVLAALTILERHGLVIGVHGRFRVAGLLAAAEPRTIVTSRKSGP